MPRLAAQYSQKHHTSSVVFISLCILLPSLPLVNDANEMRFIRAGDLCSQHGHSDRFAAMQPDSEQVALYVLKSLRHCKHWSLQCWTLVLQSVTEPKLPMTLFSGHWSSFQKVCVPQKEFKKKTQMWTVWKSCQEKASFFFFFFSLKRTWLHSLGLQCKLSWFKTPNTQYTEGITHFFPSVTRKKCLTIIC